jgi:hypothetical protein
VFATERGARPYADPLLITGVLFGQLGAEPEPRAFYGDGARAGLRATDRVGRDRARGFDALFLAGGHAPGVRQAVRA